VSDPVDSATRSRIMRAVRSKNSRMERTFRSQLWSHGVRGYRCHRRDIHGTPDLAWVGLRIAVFLDSAWFHGHSSRWVPGRHPVRWDAKIRRNVARDRLVDATLADAGWVVVRLWDFEIAADTRACVEVVRSALDERRAARRGPAVDWDARSEGLGRDAPEPAGRP
jgi:DNA mismatch endonuclease (patch repair protein)